MLNLIIFFNGMLIIINIRTGINDIKKIVKHLLLPSSLATLSEKKKIVTKIISDGTAFGFHVEDAHRRKIREWERFAVTHDDAFEENNERRKSVSEESDCVFKLGLRSDNCVATGLPLRTIRPVTRFGSADVM